MDQIGQPIADHASDQIDIRILEVGRLNPRPRPIHFRRLMRSAVFPKDDVVKMLDRELLGIRSPDDLPDESNDPAMLI